MKDYFILFVGFIFGIIFVFVAEFYLFPLDITQINVFEKTDETPSVMRVDWDNQGDDINDRIFVQDSKGKYIPYENYLGTFPGDESEKETVGNSIKETVEWKK